jgi:hypothetical protein
VPWLALCALIEPFYPKPGNGRPPVGVERMLRIYFLQQWFNLSDPAVEEAFYDSSAMRRFVDIDLGRESAPDETTVCRFRHLLASDQEGQPMVFRDEGAFRDRQPNQADPCRGGDAGQCRRQHCIARAVARRDPRVGRSSLPRPAGGDPGASAVAYFQKASSSFRASARSSPCAFVQWSRPLEPSPASTVIGLIVNYVASLLSLARVYSRLMVRLERVPLTANERQRIDRKIAMADASHLSA